MTIVFSWVTTVYNYDSREEMNEHLGKHREWKVVEYYFNGEGWTAEVQKKIKGVEAGF